MKRILYCGLAVVLALSMVLSFTACGGKDEPVDGTTATEPLTEEAVSVEDVATTAEGISEDATGAVDATEAEDASEASSEETTEVVLPETKEEILAAYTDIMNKTKVAKPGYTKIEWQELPGDAANRDIQKTSGILPMSQIIETVLNFVDKNYITDESEVRANPRVESKGNDMKDFPVYHNSKGCLLTDTSAIKSASAKELSNGNIELTIVLNAEKNPEPAAKGGATSPSKTGGIFTPLSRKNDIDPELASGAVQALAKDINYNLTYHDCMVKVEYNPVTGRIQSIDMKLYVNIAATAKILGCGVKIDQELINTVEFVKFAY